MILAADVGGTKTLVGLFTQRKGRLETVREGSFSSQESPSLERILENFLLAGKEKVHRCAVGVAGPVASGRSQVINLKWPVDARRVARFLGIPEVRILNDLEATAWGIPELPTRKFANLTPGLRSPRGNAALIAAGTGLGTAGLYWDGERHHPFASEGGHRNFAPEDDLGIGLLRFLQQRYSRVSVERVVSGPGFSAVYDYLVASGRGEMSPSMRERFAASSDRNVVISEAGVNGEDPVAAVAVEIWVSFYGSVAGDLALVMGASGGIYVGGGIAPKILPKLAAGGFVDAFRNKGRLRPFVERIPIKVILEPRTALLGAAACAACAPARPSGKRTGRKR